jgi:hypothetical protein
MERVPWVFFSSKTARTAALQARYESARISIVTSMPCFLLSRSAQLHRARRLMTEQKSPGGIIGMAQGPNSPIHSVAESELDSLFDRAAPHMSFVCMPCE